MFNHYTTKMTGPLETWIIHLSFLHFYTILQGIYSLLYCQIPYSHVKCLFTKIQSNIAIWQYIAIHSNTICNTALTHIVSPLIDTDTYINVYPHAYTNMHTQMHTMTQTNACTHTHIYTQHNTTHTHTQTCVVVSRAACFFHGATEPGKLNTMFSPSTNNSATYVILMRTLAPGGRLPTLTVNTSYRQVRCVYLNNKLNLFQNYLLNILIIISMHICTQLISIIHYTKYIRILMNSLHNDKFTMIMIYNDLQ